MVAVSGEGVEAGYKRPLVFYSLGRGKEGEGVGGFCVSLSLSALGPMTPMDGSIAWFPQRRRMAVILVVTGLAGRSPLP